MSSQRCQRVIETLQEAQERLYDASEMVLDIVPRTTANRDRCLRALESIANADALLTVLVQGERPLEGALNGR